MSFPFRLQPKPTTRLNHFALLFMIKRERPRAIRFAWALSRRKRFAQIFRDVGERDMRRRAGEVAHLPFVSTFCFSSSFIFLMVASWLLSPDV
jgi:hypothetical protein